VPQTNFWLHLSFPFSQTARVSVPAQGWSVRMLVCTETRLRLRTSASHRRSQSLVKHPPSPSSRLQIPHYFSSLTPRSNRPEKCFPLLITQHRMRPTALFLFTIRMDVWSSSSILTGPAYRMRNLVGSWQSAESANVLIRYLFVHFAPFSGSTSCGSTPTVRRLVHGIPRQ
jgi:hypothetical protein